MGFFALVWTNIAVRIETATDGVVGALQAWTGPKFQLCVVAYLIISLLIAAWSSDEHAFTRFFRQLWLAVIIYTLASNAASFDYYVTGLVNGITQAVIQAVAGVFGGSGVINANSFDNIAMKMFAAGGVVFNQVAWSAPKTWLLGMAVLGYWAISLGGILVIFMAYLVSNVVTNFVAAFGPLFIAMYFFPFTRKFFDGWLSCVVAGMLSQIFTIGWLVMFISSLGGMMTTMAASAAGTGDGVANDIATQIFMIILAGCLVSIFSMMTAFSGYLAIRISQGAHAHIKGIAMPAWATGRGISEIVQHQHHHTRGDGGSGASPDNASNGGGGGTSPNRQYAFNRSVGPAP
jgi:type IV secretory pathway VirB6-like protein